jgi:hypothetical protein
MAIGIEVDLFSRALGAKPEKSKVTLLTKMTFFFGVTFVLLGIFFSADMLLFFAKGL